MNPVNKILSKKELHKYHKWNCLKCGEHNSGYEERCKNCGKYNEGGGYNQ